MVERTEEQTARPTCDAADMMDYYIGYIAEHLPDHKHDLLGVKLAEIAYPNRSFKSWSEVVEYLDYPKPKGGE